MTDQTPDGLEIALTRIRRVADEQGLNVRNTRYVAHVGHARSAAVRCGVTIVFRQHGSSGE
ncbi:MAG: hypothetical protein E2O75_00040 [Chloroflexi bacterium]|nr:hypothetical protein [Chloroflexota bacterium]TDI94514.1 MAG: hypothetical protein E2O75_00040 [Chloroflexota bacterium]